jgi:L-ascorbate metabolism protein UlaG (beta-lactamase superfamily)
MLRPLLTALIALAASTASAQDRRPSHCIAIADAAPGLAYIQKASFADPVPEFSVRISYIDHSMFLLQTQGGLSVITDYNGWSRGRELVPDVVTMNIGHSTHFTLNPDPAIPNVLEGWGEPGAGIEHHKDLGEMLIRNVTTDIRSRFGSEPWVDGNSIFIFEVEGLCIGHLGHLHHVPTDEQFAALGRLDVVMAAVDGGLTLPTEEIVKIVERLKSSVVIPMHWFGRTTLNQFLAELSDTFIIDRDQGNSYTVSLRNLPSSPTVVVLEPQFQRGPSDF